LQSRFPLVHAMEGTAAAIPLQSASLDVVVCAQAFHWFASSQALDEIARVLRPGGKLALIWNIRDARVPWVAELDALVNTREGDTPRFHSGAWRTVFPHRHFPELKEWRFPHRHVGHIDDVIRSRVLSTSFIAALNPIEKDRVMAKVDALVARTPELAGAEAEKSARAGEKTIAVPYETWAFMARKI